MLQMVDGCPYESMHEEAHLDPQGLTNSKTAWETHSLVTRIF